jgi:hypothetical protein
MKNRKGKSSTPPAASLVIRGAATKHIPGMQTDGYAVVHAHTLYIVGDKVHGIYYDNRGCSGQFQIPLCDFGQLEYMEIGSEDEIEDDEDEDDVFSPRRAA